MAVRRRLLIRGSRVQDIGYRMFLLNLATERGLTGFRARNVDGNAVEVIYEGEEEAVLGFEDDVRRLAPEGAEVEGLEFWDYEGPVPDIERFRSHFATLQLGKIIEVGLAMIRRQDETIAEIRALSDAVTGLLDERLRKLEEDVREIKARLGLI